MRPGFFSGDTVGCGFQPGAEQVTDCQEYGSQEQREWEAQIVSSGVFHGWLMDVPEKAEVKCIKSSFRIN